MKFRKARKKDIPQMFEILKINSPKYPKKLALKELKEMFSDSLSKPKYIVLEDKKEILCFGGFTPSWIDEMVVSMFWVNTKQEHKGKGIGIKLIKELIRKIKTLNKPKPKMIILSTKIPLFFKKFGFKTIQKKYDRDYDLMALKV